MQCKNEQVFVVGVENGKLVWILVQKIVAFGTNVSGVIAVICNVVGRKICNHADLRREVVGVSKLETGTFKYYRFVLGDVRYFRRKRNTAVTEQTRRVECLVQHMLNHATDRSFAVGARDGNHLSFAQRHTVI